MNATAHQKLIAANCSYSVLS